MSEVTTTKQNVQTASTVKKITATAVMAALTTLMTTYIFHNRSTAKEVCQAVDRYLSVLTCRMQLLTMRWSDRHTERSPLMPC